MKEFIKSIRRIEDIKKIIKGDFKKGLEIIREEGKIYLETFLQEENSINFSDYRIKPAESIVFKCLYTRTPNVNRIFDISGARILEDDVGSCYCTFEYLLQKYRGMYFIDDNINRKGYTAINLTIDFKEIMPIQIQISTKELWKIIEADNEFKHASYELAKVRKLHKYMNTDLLYNIDFREKLLLTLIDNITEGVKNFSKKKTFYEVLDNFSSEKNDEIYTYFRKLNMSKKFMKYLG